MMEMVLEKIKGSRGILWRKTKNWVQNVKSSKVRVKLPQIKKEQTVQKEKTTLPSFKHEPLDSFVELPRPEDVSKVDVKRRFGFPWDIFIHSTGKLIFIKGTSPSYTTSYPGCTE